MADFNIKPHNNISSESLSSISKKNDKSRFSNQDAEFDEILAKKTDKIENKIEIISDKFSETKKLDDYISQQAQKIYLENTEIKNENKNNNHIYSAKNSDEITDIAYNEADKLDIYISKKSKSNETGQIEDLSYETFESESAHLNSIVNIKEHNKHNLNKQTDINLYSELKYGSKSHEIKNVQQALNKWLPKLKLKTNGVYNSQTAKAISLFKAIYNTGSEGKMIGKETSRLLLGLIDGSFWKYDPSKNDSFSPPKTIAGEILHKAASYLGVPYVLGGDGVNSTDCAMLTRNALIKSGISKSSFTRLADIQYQMAEKNQGNLTLVSSPKPGDIIFFKNTSSQAGEAYKGITHVGIYVSENVMIAASPYHGGVTLQNIDDINPKKIAGYARVTVESGM